MKKNTLKFFMFCALAVSGLVSAQSNLMQKTNATSLELNATSQASLDQTGFVRCATDEMHAKRLSNNPNLQSDAEFEAWLAPLVAAKKAQIAQQKASGNFQQIVVNMPIVFHVITDGTAPSNISGALVQAQIDQLNLDFSNQAGADGGFWDGRDADAEVVFIPAQVDPNGAPMAEPGVNRVTTFGAGPFPTGAFDGAAGSGQIKPETVWDRSQYVNVWVAQITGGILGYAQFPSNSTLPGLNVNGGTELNDGVVIGTGTVGSVAMPGSAAPYNMGRTLTHEIGHWIGLRHIWGDTDCSGDDFCADTPNAGASNFGCNTTTDSCNTDADRDMVENYMDYTDDSCMNIFTNDQVLRIATVIANADGISDLPNSTTGSAGPAISFSTATLTQAEGTDCSFTDVDVDIVIGAGASASTTVNFTATSVTANSGSDFELNTSSVTFASGDTTAQTITLRIFNDSYVEGDETFTIGFTVNANGGDATVGNDSLTVTISDDDAASTGTLVVQNYFDDFEDMDASDWTFTDSDGDGNSFGDQFSIGAVTPSSSLISRSWIGTALTPDNWAVSPAIDLTGVSGTINLDWKVQAAAAAWDLEEYSVYVSTSNNIATLVNATTTFNEIYNDAADAGSSYARTLDLSAHAGDIIYVAFRHWNCSDQDWLSIDDVSVSSSISQGVQTAVNTATQAQVNLNGSGVAYTFDTASTNDFIADVNVTDTSNYGCTTLNVSRSGTSGEPFQGSISPALVSNKTFTITPTTDNSAGTSTLSFYFTEAELAGWEAITGDNRSNLRIGKDNGTSVTDVASTITAFGSDWKVTGDFINGIEGTYYFGNLAFLSTSDFKFDAFAMYPNPSNNQVTIKFNTTNDVAINLYDIHGRTVLNKTFTSQSSSFNQNLNVSALATGIYVVKIESGNNTMFRKLVVN